MPGRRNVLIVGDSHGAQLWSGLAATYPDAHFMQATVSGCYPALKPNGDADCARTLHQILTEFIPQNHPDTVLLAARWRSISLQALIETAQALRPHAGRVVVMGRIVEYKNPLPQLLAISLWQGRHGLVDRQREPESVAVAVAVAVAVDAEYAKAMAAAGISYVSLQDALCDRPGCITTDDAGLPIQFDYGHLTAEGSTLLARRLRDHGFSP